MEHVKAAVYPLASSNYTIHPNFRDTNDVEAKKKMSNLDKIYYEEIIYAILPEIQ